MWTSPPGNHRTRSNAWLHSALRLSTNPSTEGPAGATGTASSGSFSETPRATSSASEISRRCRRRMVDAGSSHGVGRTRKLNAWPSPHGRPPPGRSCCPALPGTGRRLPSGYSTRRRPEGPIDGSKRGRSTTNSVRCAGKMCSDTSTGVSSTSRVTRSQRGRTNRYGQQLGVHGVGGGRTDRLGGAADRHADQLVERHLLHVGARQPCSQLLRAPHRDPGEGLAVGQVDPAHAGRRGDEPEAHDPALGADPQLFELLLDGAEPPQRLTDGVGGDEPTEPLAGVDQALVAQQVERLADGDAAHPVGSGQLALAGKEAAGPELAGLHPSPELVGNRPVADLAHLLYTCLHLPPRQGRRAMALPQSPPSTGTCSASPHPEPPPKASAPTAVEAHNLDHTTRSIHHDWGPGAMILANERR